MEKTGKEEVKVPLFAQYNFICQRLKTPPAFRTQNHFESSRTQN